MKNPAPSKAMKAAIAFAKRGDGVLERHPGGYWSIPGMRVNGGVPAEYVKSVSVEGLVRRKYADYTAYQEGRRGRFPVEMTLIARPDRLAELLQVRDQLSVWAAQEIEALREKVAAAYQIVGVIGHQFNTFDHPDVVRALDYLNGKPIDGEILPWPRTELVPETDTASTQVP